MTRDATDRTPVEQAAGAAHGWGVSGLLPGGGTIPDDFPYGAIRTFQWDAETRTARMGDTPVRIPVAPFFGTIGVAPPVLSGRGSTSAPDRSAATSTTRSWSPAPRFSCRCWSRVRCCRSETGTLVDGTKGVHGMLAKSLFP